MKTFDFLVDCIPPGYAFNFDNYLFNKIRHNSTQGLPDRVDFFLVNNVKKRIEGKIHFLLSDQIAYSPYRSLFGSFEFNPRIHPNLLSEFWQFIENDLRVRNIKEVRITGFAECYAMQKAELIHRTLEKNGFSVVLKAVNHHISVNDDPLDSRMHQMELRRLAKCHREGFYFTAETADKSMEIYDFIEQCRVEQQLQVSIGRRQFIMYLEEFQQNYQLFSVRSGRELLAATMGVVVHRRVLYNFLPASPNKYDAFSPSVMLLHGLYGSCQGRGIELLDLGISTTSDGLDQESLIAFKERMGGEASYKYSYRKRLD